MTSASFMSVNKTHIHTLNIPIIPSKACSSCKKYRGAQMKNDAQIAELKQKIKELTSTLEQFKQANAQNDGQDDNILRIPNSAASNMLKRNSIAVKKISRLKNPGENFNFDEINKEDIQTLTQDLAIGMGNILSEYFKANLDSKPTVMLEVYIVLKVVHHTRFGQDAFPHICSELKKLLENFIPITPGNTLNREVLYEIKDFDDNITLSDVYPCASCYLDIDTIKNKEFNYVYSHTKALPTDVTVAKLLHGYAKEIFKVFEQDLQNLLEKQCEGKSFKANLKAIDRLLAKLDEYASEKKKPAFEGLGDVLRCRIAFTDYHKLKDCYDKILRRYRVTRVKNKLDSQLSNVTLNIEFNEMIAEIQLVFGTIESEFQNHMIYELIRCQNIQEMYKVVKGWSSFQSISVLDSCQGKIIDSRPLDVPETFSTYEMKIPYEGNSNYSYRVLRSKENGNIKDFSSSFSSMNKKDIKRIENLYVIYGDSGIQDICLTIPEIQGDINFTTIPLTNQTVKRIIGSYDMKCIRMLEFHFYESSQFLTVGNSGDFTFEINIPNNYYLVGIGGKKSPEDKIQTLFTYISTLKPTTVFPDRSWYEGEIIEGKREGFGVYEDKLGNRYEGNWKADEQNGQGMYLDYEGEYIYGNFENNNPSGKAIHLNRKGMFGIENFENGVLNGFIKRASGPTVIEAQYQNDLRQNEGIYLHDHQIYLIGIFNQHNLKAGMFYEAVNPIEETVTLRNGDTFTGKKHSNQIIGKSGTLIYASKSKYEGEFLNSLRHGQGTFTNELLQERYEGSWKEDKPHGWGKTYYRNGDVIESSWQNGVQLTGFVKRPNSKKEIGNYYLDGKIIEGYDSEYVDNVYFYGCYKNRKYDGEGTFYYKNGCILKGNWKSGELNGKSIFKMPDGREFEGIYEDDKLISGEGIIKFSDLRDEIYLGTITSNQTKAFMHMNSRFIYEGELDIQLLKRGKGVMVFTNNDKIEGYWEYHYLKNYAKITFANGETLEGNWERSYIHGDATYTTISGQILKPHFEHGRWTSNQGVMYIHEKLPLNYKDNGTQLSYDPKKIRYEGSVDDGNIKTGKLIYPDGLVWEVTDGKFATVTFKDGTRYEGEWKWTKGRHGNGKMFDLDGKSYDCQYENNKPKNGTALFSNKQGYISIVEVKNFVKNGYCKWITPEKKEFEGTYKDNEIYSGYGVKLYNHKYLYVGFFNHGKRDGEAVVYVQGGSGIVLKGVWRDDKPISGQAFTRFYVNEFYEGEVLDGNNHGKGVYYYGNKSVYEGEWKNNLKENLGKWTFCDGLELTMNFKKGVPFAPITVKKPGAEVKKYQNFYLVNNGQENI